MRPIDADELRKDIVERGAQLSGCYSAGIARYMDRMLAHVLAEVDSAPTVDAVPVVRCKDCKHNTAQKSCSGTQRNGRKRCFSGTVEFFGTDIVADDYRGTDSDNRKNQ